MITPFEIYLISLADSLSTFWSLVFLTAFFCSIYFAASWLMHYQYLDNEDRSKKTAKKLLITFFVTTIVSLFFWMTIPTSKTLAAMYVLPKIDSTSLEKIPKNLAKFANAWLKEEAKQITQKGSTND